MGSVTLCVPITVPAQLSVAVGASSELTEHSAVIFANVAAFGTGAVISLEKDFSVANGLPANPASTDCTLHS